jgi:rod shape-determining protein MreC
VRSYRRNSVLRLAAPLRVLWRRFSFAFLCLLCLSFILLGRLNPWAIEQARLRVTDASVPLFAALSQPLVAFEKLVGSVRGAFALYDENQNLKAENSRLMQWQTLALKLQSENQQLQKSLNLAPKTAPSFITAELVARPIGPFSNTVVVNAGSKQGVRTGIAAFAQQGLVGRVTDAGVSASRIMLLTDMSSRIPITIERTRDRAILAGDNTKSPKLLYLPPESGVVVGDRVVTSGHGGVFPSGLAIGVVAAIDDQDGIRITPFADLDRLDYVQLVDYQVDLSASAD